MTHDEARALLASQPDGTILVLASDLSPRDGGYSSVMLKVNKTWVSHEEPITVVFYTSYLVSRIVDDKVAWSFS